jgi:2,4-dienoyl-CoA reductase-like NADH-dependent reductase (Old Yellow Enzyme family)
MTITTPISVLAQPITFPNSGLTAPNRFLKSAMTERLCTYNDDDPTDLEGRGQVTKEYEELYRVWGEGQIGTIVLGNLPIQREGLEAKKNMIIDKDNVSTSFEPLCQV